jgi:hypothetical protein
MAELNLVDLAEHYFVSDLPGSTILASRLREILDKLQEGRPLTTNGVNYLRQLGLTALGQLAHGDITYAAFREIAAAEQTKREQVVEAERQAKHAAMLAGRLNRRRVRRSIGRSKRQPAWRGRVIPNTLHG